MKLYKLNLFLLAFCSCTSSNDKALPEYGDIDGTQLTKNLQKTVSYTSEVRNVEVKTNEEDFLYLSSICDSIWGVKLETTESSILGGVDKMKIADNKIYILDRYKTKSLKKFSIDGKFITSFGDQGKGPAEYYEPTDFFVLSNSVVIYDQFGAKLNYYDLTGKFIRTRRVPFILTSLLFIDENEILCHTFSTDNYHVKEIMDYSLLWCDSSYNINYVGALRTNDVVNNFQSKNNIDMFNGRIIYHEPFSDTIFSLNDKGSIAAKYVVNFEKKYRIPKAVFDENKKKELLKMLSSDYASYFGGQVVLKDYLYFPYSVNHLVYHVFYSTKTSEVVTGSSVINDINYLYDLSEMLQCYDNTLIGYMDASNFVNNVNNAKEYGSYELLDDKLKDWSSGISFSDNPILVFCMLKEF